MSEPIIVEDNNFDQMVLKAKTPVLVDFWAPWCRPCKMIAPILDELAGEYGEKMTIARINVDENPKTAASYSIRAIPSMLLFKQGKPITNIVGFKPKAQLKEDLDAALS